MRKRDVAVRPLLAARRLIRAVDGGLSASLLVLARLILLGKENVEGDRSGIGLRQSLDQRRHRLARPRPAPDAPDRLIVDVDNADRLIEIVGARAPTLILIENEILEIGPERPEQRAQGERQQIGQQDDQHIGPPLAHMRTNRAELHQIDDRWRNRPSSGDRHIVAMLAEHPGASTSSRERCGNPIQISLSPLSEAWPSRPTMMWSWTITPRGLAIAMMSSVILTSWVEGEGSPEG